MSPTPLFNSFHILNEMEKEDDVEVQVEGSFNEPNAMEANVASSSKPNSSLGGFDVGEFGESDEDEVFEPDDGMARYLSSSGGGQQLEANDFDFSYGYEAQFYDLHGQLDAFCD